MRRMATPTLIATRGAADYQALIRPVIDALDRIVVGKSRQIALSVACMLARGHLLIEDVPGVGKTTLAHALARALGLSYHRVQFTSAQACAARSMPMPARGESPATNSPDSRV